MLAAPEMVTLADATGETSAPEIPVGTASASNAREIMVSDMFTSSIKEIGERSDPACLGFT